jgi:hypothetical protein
VDAGCIGPGPKSIGAPASLEAAAFMVVHGTPDVGPHAVTYGSGLVSN